MKLSYCLLGGLLLTTASAQLATRTGMQDTPQAENPPHRTRLILKDGSFQIVMSYKVVGSRVQYVSAERGGNVEEIPLELVDLEATKKWEQRHTVQPDSEGAQRPMLDPELAKEEADRVTVAPEVAPDLRLAPEDAVLALDTWQGTPELVPLLQSEGDLNRQTGHTILRGVINPSSARHQMVILRGDKAPVQMHVTDPAIYLHLDDSTLPGVGAAMTVDTGGASSRAAVKDSRKGASRYAIVQVDVRRDARIVGSFDTSGDGAAKPQDDLIATNTTVLPGGHWAKIVPAQPLLFGEYCLVEVLADNQINLSVWDFGIHPTAPENRDVLRPEKRRPVTLEHRPDN